MPPTDILPFENGDLQDYDKAHRLGKKHVFCASAFPKCTISLIELALGKIPKPLNFM